MRPSNAALKRMKAGDVALGMLVRLVGAAEIAHLAKSSGHDFLFLDTQHSLISLDAISGIVKAAMGCDIATFVRVRDCRDHDILRLLDAGANGIVVPDVRNAEEARAAVERVKFAPVGRRSVSGGYSAFGYQPIPLKQITQEINENTVLVCMIENVEGLGNLEEIAKVPGVDVLHIGCNDLLTDMGKHGQFGDPEILDAIARVIDACRRNGKFCGIGGDRDVARQTKFMNDGVQFVTTHSDLAFLLAEASRRVEAIRGTRSERG